MPSNSSELDIMLSHPTLIERLRDFPGVETREHWEGSMYHTEIFENGVLFVGSSLNIDDIDVDKEGGPLERSLTITIAACYLIQSFLELKQAKKVSGKS